jgi:hypothetical protein
VRRLEIALGAASLLLILVGSVLPALRSVNSDFSNYYLPARLVARGESTADLYEFSWFQRQMIYAGIEDRSGAFNRFPPPAGLVMLPLGWLEPLTAKRVWTLVSLAALLSLLVLLEKMAGLPLAWGLALAAILGMALRNNFLFGQFYIVLSLLIAASLYFRGKGLPGRAGVLLGVASAVKLYPAPLALYLGVRREWSLLGGFALGVLGAFALSLAAFGVEVNALFFQSVLPASLAGLTDNPFHPALQSATSLLRRLLVREPTLNPEPLLDAAPLFYGLRYFFSLGVLVSLVFILRRRKDLAEESLLLLGLLLISPVVLSYHALLALPPLAFFLPRLWRQGRRGMALTAAALYALAASPAALWWPQAQIRLAALLTLTALLLAQARPLRLPRSAFPAVAALAVLLAFFSARPGVETDEATPVAWGRARSESPAVAPGRLVFSAIDGDRYVAVGLPEFTAGGSFFSPVFSRSGGSLFFEVAERGHSRVVELRGEERRSWTRESLGCGQPSPDAFGLNVVASCQGDLFLFRWDPSYLVPSSRRLTVTPWDEVDPELSPDGTRVVFASRQHGSLRLVELEIQTGALRALTAGGEVERGPRYSPGGGHLAFARRRRGSWDIWVSDLSSGREWRLTRHPGNDTQPAWSPDGRALYFASDRDRGLFMPAIYRLELPGEI